jgi:hypothetical protein
MMRKMQKKKKTVTVSTRLEDSLQYLRRKAYDGGYNKIPRVKA